MPTVQQMIELSDTLTKTQTRIFEYMLNHPEAVCYDTLRNTAERIGVTEVSVLKVCRKLGCSGYAEMKEVFRHYVGERLKDSFDRSYTLETVDDRSRSDRGALLRSMFEAEQQGITALAASIGEEQIFDCAQTLMNAREVLLFGHDVSKVMADYFAHRLNSRVLKKGGVLLNMDTDYGPMDFTVTSRLAKNAHHGVEGSLIQLCQELKDSVRISTHRRPGWDVERLLSLGFSEVTLEKDIRPLVHLSKEWDYDPAPLFCIRAVKDRN